VCRGLPLLSFCATTVLHCSSHHASHHPVWAPLSPQAGTTHGKHTHTHFLCHDLFPSKTSTKLPGRFLCEKLHQLWRLHVVLHNLCYLIIVDQQTGCQTGLFVGPCREVVIFDAELTQARPASLACRLDNWCGWRKYNYGPSICCAELLSSLGIPRSVHQPSRIRCSYE